MKKYVLFFIMLALLFTISGCSLGGKKPVAAGPLGILRSDDSGVNWKSKSAIKNVQGKIMAFSDTSINKIVVDPQDRNTLYIATSNGLYYSYDRGESWQKVEKFSVNISDVAVDYKEKCTIYVVFENKVYKSTDCSREWNQIYQDDRANTIINDIETDFYNNQVVYMANNAKEVLKSEDGGQTWSVIKRLKSAVKQIVIDSTNSSIIYVASQGDGIYKSSDNGATWSDETKETDLNNALKAVKGVKDYKTFYYMVQDKSQTDTFILASKHGLLKTTDGGASWQDVPLLTPANSTVIYSLAIDPKDGNIIYYGTDSIFYKSTDGGKNWQTAKSPTRGVINFILIDPQESKTLYIGGKEIKK